MISVIIPALNEEESIGDCLCSLLEQTVDRDSYEIIVVDGGSDDRTREIAERYADLVVPQRRSGIGGARRDGAEAAQGEILVFSDADTLYGRDWLAVIRENLTGQGYDVSTGPVLFYDRTLNSDLVRLWRTQYKILHLFDFYWLIGSNVATRRDAYDRIGGHQDISILEDYDLSVRLFREGDIACCDDRRQAVYTSARRFHNLPSYMKTFLHGHYHYHVTKDHEQLLRYPRFDATDRHRLFGTGGSKRAERRTGAGYATFVSSRRRKQYRP